MMMMIGDPHRANPTVKIPLCVDYHDPTAHIHSPIISPNAYLALQRYLPSNNNDDGEDLNDDFDVPVDAFSCDNFRMYDFKVKKCSRARSHDWTECPFAHPGEKARRRDPRKYRYSGGACPYFRKGACDKGDDCEYAHGVFEVWLHPDRYRTLPCKDGTHCRRRVCFFAHTPDQIRIGSDGSDPFMMFGSSPRSTLLCSPSCSPPISEITELIRTMQINKAKLGVGIGFGSPGCASKIRPGFMSVPGTWEEEEEPLMERVESGRELRERIYEKLGRENSLDRVTRI